MASLADMIWVEGRKAVRSKMPLWTALGSLFVPLGITFLIYISKNPDISDKLGLIAAKANLAAYYATDWPAYMTVYGGVISAAGLFLFILVITWIFGREFSDATVKDLLAVPVPRASILLAKFIVAAIWAEGLTVVLLIAGLLAGALLRLPGGSLAVVLTGTALVLKTSALVLAVAFPLALFASLGRGYLLPIGVAVLLVMLINMSLIVGWGAYWPWAVPILYAQGQPPLAPVSYAIVWLTGLAGMLATYAWWQLADQNK